MVGPQGRNPLLTTTGSLGLLFPPSLPIILYGIVAKIDMAEIRALFSRLDPSLTIHSDYAFGVSEFTLENGSTQLAKFFSKVQTIPFTGDLEVTEAEPLLAYVHSMIALSNNKFTDQDWIGLRQFIDQEILTTGSFHISKSTGIFIAER